MQVLSLSLLLFVLVTHAARISPVSGAIRVIFRPPGMEHSELPLIIRVEPNQQVASDVTRNHWPDVSTSRDPIGTSLTLFSVVAAGDEDKMKVNDTGGHDAPLLQNDDASPPGRGSLPPNVNPSEGTNSVSLQDGRPALHRFHGGWLQDGTDPSQAHSVPRTSAKILRNQSLSDRTTIDRSTRRMDSVELQRKQTFQSSTADHPKDDLQKTLTSTTAQDAIPLPGIMVSSTTESGNVTGLHPTPKLTLVENKRGPPVREPPSPPRSTSEEALSIEDQWRELEKTFRLYTGSVIKRVLPKILRIHSQLNVSSQCNAALLQLMSGVRSMKSWAVKMVDASGRLPSGTLGGTLTDLGDYDQCLEVLRPSRLRHRALSGQYCTLELKPTLPALEHSVTLDTKVLDFGNVSSDSVLADLSQGSALFHFMVMRIGVCVPSTCVDEDIRELARAVLGAVPVLVSVRNCEVKQDFHLTITQFIVIGAAAAIAMLVVIGTGLESVVRGEARKPREIGRVPQSLLAFSAAANVRKLLSTSARASPLQAVNGVRCLSLAWIVLAHTYGFGHRQGLARLSHAKAYMDDVLFQIITNAWVSVDTFFLLGGLLVATSNLKSMERTGGKIEFMSHVLHRVWRLTPPLAATLGVMFLLPLIGSGPLWPDMLGKKVANCEKNWWQVFLPINTWVDFNSMCLLHTWYIASDMHFYCAAPFLLMILFRWPGAGLVLIFSATAACALATGLITVFNSLPPTVIFFSPDIAMTKWTANLIYFRPYPHFGAYCVGLVLGYFLWKWKKLNLTKSAQAVGWCSSCVCCAAVLFATYPWSRGRAATAAEAVAYAALHRTAWAAGVAWVLLVCATGHGSVLNKFLGWKAFLPLSRLCYSVYLLHFPVLWVRVSWRRSLLNFHHYDIVTEFFGILMITLGLSVLFHLIFEAPFLNLEEIWFPRNRKTDSTSKTTESKPSIR